LVGNVPRINFNDDTWTPARADRFQRFSCPNFRVQSYHPAACSQPPGTIVNKTETTAPWPSCVQRGTLL